mmetsp:Transcript_24697/g.35577  ORF Transcript_24697/g.35577 Transcript_24697/m.35577 type:complete len:226 (-) Transcript_24697:355-1032(-)|eukprot:CAMPEP_0184744938 /NCGR_PEP_ID=MMETSP0315-20130426/7688_1 /TAXON_ID=101924 /ORGANISM="Rhodosorus marinus, Strain UTEX LB 2760" /LENGTH=225 /DNA_ID=CAMNT_0027216927 /DNA_START=206 /DNA_END=883 /DNA_ORIENTATION=-
MSVSISDAGMKVLQNARRAGSATFWVGAGISGGWIYKQASECSVASLSFSSLLFQAKEAERGRREVGTDCFEYKVDPKLVEGVTAEDFGRAFARSSFFSLERKLATFLGTGKTRTDAELRNFKFNKGREVAITFVVYETRPETGELLWRTSDAMDGYSWMQVDAERGVFRFGSGWNAGDKWLIAFLPIHRIYSRILLKSAVKRLLLDREDSDLLSAGEDAPTQTT